MPDVADQPAQPTDRRGRRIYVWWAVGLTLLVLLGVFCWTVVVPAWRVHSALAFWVKSMYDRSVADRGANPQIGANAIERLSTQETIASLGGPTQAARLLSRYIRSSWADGLPSDRLDASAVPRKSMARTLLIKCGDPAVDHFLEDLASPDIQTRRFALQWLATMGPDAARAVPQLTEALTDGSQLIRGGAAQALGSIGPPARESTSALTPLLRDDDEGVRCTSARALGRIGDPSAVVALKEALKDGSAHVRQAAQDALARIGNPHGRLWRDGQVVEFLGRIYPSRANARYYITRNDGESELAVHLRGQAIDALDLVPGDKLRVKGHIKYEHVPAPAGYDPTRPSTGIELPQTFCYLDVSEVEVFKPTLTVPFRLELGKGLGR